MYLVGSPSVQDPRYWNLFHSKRIYMICAVLSYHSSIPKFQQFETFLRMNNFFVRFVYSFLQSLTSIRFLPSNLPWAVLEPRSGSVASAGRNHRLPPPMITYSTHRAWNINNDMYASTYTNFYDEIWLCLKHELIFMYTSASYIYNLFASVSNTCCAGIIFIVCFFFNICIKKLLCKFYIISMQCEVILMCVSTYMNRIYGWPIWRVYVWSFPRLRVLSS